MTGNCQGCRPYVYKKRISNPITKNKIYEGNKKYMQTKVGKDKKNAADRLRGKINSKTIAYRRYKSAQNYIKTRLATPKWENKTLSKKIYKIANDIQKVTGVKMDVDHIIPLKADTVCGLNVWYNLTIIPRYINSLKNKNVLPEIVDHIANKVDWMEYIDSKYSFLCKTFPNQERFETYIEKQKELFKMIMDKKNHKKNPTLYKLYLMFQTSSGGGKTFTNYLMCLPVSY